MKLWRIAIDSEELTAQLLDRNSDRLCQATIDGTPFSQGPRFNLLGTYGTINDAEKILQGTLDYDSLPFPVEAIDWVRELAYGADGPPE